MDIKDLIHQSNLIEGFDMPYADRLSYCAWKKLIKKTEISHALILKTQKLITLHQSDILPNQRGYYRGMAGNNVNVFVGKRVCPAWPLVRAFMDNWLLDYQDMGPHKAHIRFEHIHPFADGNGRTGRLLMWWQQYINGDELTPITYENRQEYYAWF